MEIENNKIYWYKTEELAKEFLKEANKLGYKIPSFKHYNYIILLKNGYKMYWDLYYALKEYPNAEIIEYTGAEQNYKELYSRLKEDSKENEAMYKRQIEELKEGYVELKAINKVLSNEVTKNSILKQDCLTTCCGIPICDIPKIKEENEKLKGEIFDNNKILPRYVIEVKKYYESPETSSIKVKCPKIKRR